MGYFLWLKEDNYYGQDAWFTALSWRIKIKLNIRK